MQAQTIVLIPSSTNTRPTVTPMATTLIQGSIMQTNPPTISRMPIANTQPHARTPKAFRSNALTNLDMPENSSHIVNRNGSDSIVNH